MELLLAYLPTLIILFVIFRNIYLLIKKLSGFAGKADNNEIEIPADDSQKVGRKDIEAEPRLEKFDQQADVEAGWFAETELELENLIDAEDKFSVSDNNSFSNSDSDANSAETLSQQKDSLAVRFEKSQREKKAKYEFKPAGSRRESKAAKFDHNMKQNKLRNGSKSVRGGNKLFAQFDSYSEAEKAIIYSEIISKPVAKRKA
jgi:hypothetical protein